MSYMFIAKTKKGPDSDSPRPIFGVGELEFSRHQV